MRRPRVLPGTALAAVGAPPGPSRLFVVYCVFFLLVCLYTFPLILDPGGLLRRYADSRLFAWVLGWVARQLFEDPRVLFHGNILYPHGNTLAFSEPLLVPAVLAFAPVHAVSRNPILAYNVSVLVFQSLSGWAGYYAARCLTGSALAGWLTGIVFALSPFQTGYYNFVPMQFSFAIPLAFLWFARFLERQRVRDLALALAFAWCQMVSVWYFGIALALLLGACALGFVLLRPSGWRPRTFVVAVVGGIVLALAILPIAWPYLETRREMGFERSLAEAARRSADLLSYLDAGPDHRFYRVADSRRYPGLFPGFTVFVLTAVAFLGLRRRDVPSLPRFGAWTRRLVGWSLAATPVVIAVFLATGGGRLSLLGLTLRMTELDRAVGLLLILGTAWLALEGWTWARAGGERPLRPGDWVILLGLLAVLFILLSLGPVVRLEGQAVGQGIYTFLYGIFPPLRAIRIPLRIGLVAVFLLGLLAAFGLAWAEARLAGSRIRYALNVVPLLLLVEYVSFPLACEAVRWDDPPPVYRWLAQEPGDFAIVEWPSESQLQDATYSLWSLLHRKHLVNGASGFDPAFTQRVRAAIAELPDLEALAVLRSIYPLRFLIVHLEELRGDDRERWEQVGQNPPDALRVVRRFGDSLVFELESGLEQRRSWERTFSTGYVARHPRVRVTVALTRADPKIQQAVEVSFNGRSLAQLRPTAASSEVDLLLPPPYPKVERNILRLELGYRLLARAAAEPRYRIGQTGVSSPVDLLVTSAGKAHGNAASILVNGVEVAPNRRGYNMAVVDAQSGKVTARAVFDTFTHSEGARLAAFVRDARSGAIVVAAIKDDGVGALPDDAVRAFHSLGGSIDPRGSPFVSHLLIGVKGARPGTAVELVGQRRLDHAVGVDRRDRLLLVRDFRLE